MRVFYSDTYEAPLPPGHRFPMEKYRLVREALLERGRIVLEAARQRGLPAVLTLGDGDAKPLSATIGAHVSTYEVAMAMFR